MVTKLQNRNEVQGSFRLMIWDRNSYALFKRESDDLFSTNGNINVLIYLDADALDDSDSSAMFLALGLAKSPYLNVVLSTDDDSEIARGADVVLNLFSYSKSGFCSGLVKYDDGTRVFVKKVDLALIKAGGDFRDFVSLIRNSVAEAKRKVRFGGFGR